MLTVDPPLACESSLLPLPDDEAPDVLELLDELEESDDFELDDPASRERGISPPKSRSSSRLMEPEADFLSPVVKVEDEPLEVDELVILDPEPLD